MFTTIVVQPIFNLLVLIYALLPGHNFGLSLIIFTVVIRLLLWPFLRKQLHQSKVMRQLQPEIKRVKQAAKGDRQKESRLLMELYKERGVNPVGTLPTLIIQFIVLIGLYSGLRRVIADPHNIVSFAYPGLQHLSWLRELAHNIHKFDNTLFGVIDLGRSALGKHGVYWPAMALVAGSAIVQYFQSKQLLPQPEQKRSLRTILREAGQGKQADQTEVNAAVGRTTIYLLPVMIFLFTVNLASALSLYWFVGGLVALVQQSIVLGRDEQEMEAIADATPTGKRVKDIPEAEVVQTTDRPQPAAGAPKKKRKRSAAKKRRKS